MIYFSQAQTDALLLEDKQSPYVNVVVSRADNAQSPALAKLMAALRAPVDAFFDDVMVNAEDPALKANRLGLLKTLHEAMNRVADLGRLAA